MNILLIFAKIFILIKMVRTVYTPDSNNICVSIPDRYIGTELEILVFPVHEISNLQNNMQEIEHYKGKILSFSQAEKKYKKMVDERYGV